MPFDERVLNGMGVLTATVDRGSFATAGELLDMSQSGVSRSIARLGARLGIRPFDCTTRFRIYETKLTSPSECCEGFGGRKNTHFAS